MCWWCIIYRTRVRSLHWQCLSLTHWLTNSVAFSKLDWPWRVKMSIQNLLRLLLFLMKVMRIVLATVCCRFGSWGLVIKLKFVQTFCTLFKILKFKFRRDFEAESWSVFCCWIVWLRLRSWILVKILKLGLVKIFTCRFSRDADVWLRFWN